MNLRTKCVIIGIASIPIITQASNASAGDTNWYPVALWEMNEGPKQSVLHDSTGNGFVGTIGTRIIKNGKYQTFPREDKQAFRPQHIDRIPDNDILDPGFGDFAVVARFKWGNNRHDINIVQKGQGNPTGGIFKMKTSLKSQAIGGIKCLFRGSAGNSQVESYPNHSPLNDGKWHTVRCERTVDGSSMFIDGVFVDNNPNLAGEISNDWPITIGGNIKCEQYLCNYWWGKIGYVRWVKN